MTIRRKVISLHCPASEVRETSQHLPTRTSKQRGTSKFMIPVPLFDLKFLPELAPSAVGTSNRRTGDLIVTSEISDRLLRMDHAAESRDSGAGGGPLHGIRVVDLTRVYSGPYCTFLLAMAGADVIKVEPPEGDSLRNRKGPGGAALPFAMLNANKRMVTLNLKEERGWLLLRSLMATADVLVENFRPGVMDRIGLGRDAVRAGFPRLIYASASGYGSDGPYRDYPAMDLTVQAMSGVMSITGFPENAPVKSGAALCDFFGGVHLYGAIVTALLHRERTGEGSQVDVAMLEAVYPSLASSIGMTYG